MKDDSILTTYPRTPVAKDEPSNLPVNWPDNVTFLEDYHYHPAIDKALLNVIRFGARFHSSGRRKNISFFPGPQLQTGAHEQEQESAQRQREEEREIGGTSEGATEILQNQQHHEDEHEVRAEKEEEEQGDERNNTTEESEGEELSLEDEYLELPLGDAIPGTALGTLHPRTQTPLFEIRKITTPATHPVLGSYGLFACQPLRPGTHLLDYISEVAPDHVANPDSDHTLYLMRDLNLDASFKGNQARFVNDFRGIRPYEQGPNLGWDLYVDRRTGQVRMGGKVLKRIRAGEEILCTYGKGFWRSRGIKVSGNEWEDSWDTDLEDWSSSDEDKIDKQE
ncbi:hypothetical protein BGW42_005534 [Actinomortierella wolfii]|nr:hypothetical protein BGW42_005534 [Actinomortierella wolfii]